MKRFLVPIVAIALGAPFSGAHDFWLVPVTSAGLWYVRTIHMREAHSPPVEWESFWAGLTFTVR